MTGKMDLPAPPYGSDQTYKPGNREQVLKYILFKLAVERMSGNCKVLLRNL